MSARPTEIETRTRRWLRINVKAAEKEEWDEREKLRDAHGKQGHETDGLQGNGSQR